MGTRSFRGRGTQPLQQPTATPTYSTSATESATTNNKAPTILEIVAIVRAEQPPRVINTPTDVKAPIQQAGQPPRVCNAEI